ncbi:MAG: Nucleotidyl transferase [Candidatus Parvarchaeum acidophilus ARMAN-5]|jgi:NDP-sugar pyrophosphorylase family protein|uniref:Nucleotidyl transferase n=1 Tax=Candidatus Parvarchaeum acidophilus ARMAN-5 TaxID=662762 RepID=D6GUJ5_PARA5|nr:MAG: Nucleotidyl transferase [Candidatus Parvarchaeum acidophilus ARMAN-5]
MKARTSFTIDADVVAKLDSLVDNIYYRSKSEAVEDILRKYFEKQNTAIVLCGGEFTVNGTEYYRPLVKVGESTVIERIITNLRMNNFRNIMISGKTELLKQIFTILKNGEGYGVDIKYIDDNNLKGSAKALERVKQYVGSTTLFVTGDSVFDIDLKDMLRFHIAHNSPASMAIYIPPDTSLPTKDKVVLKGSKIQTYEKLPDFVNSKLIPTSIFLLDQDVFKYIPPGDIEWNIKQDLLPLLAKDGLLFGYMYNGSWMPIKTKEDMEKAKKLS